jgi:purine-binding chemotaxis protein CheW
VTIRLYATFTVNNTLFGVDATDVQEVLAPQRLTRVPRASPEVLGLINLRGQVVVTIDMRRLLGLPDRDQEATPVNVVLRTEDGPISVAVDEVGDVLEASDDELDHPPETLSQPTRALVTAVQKLDDELLLVLDVKRTAQPMRH